MRIFYKIHWQTSPLHSGVKVLLSIIGIGSVALSYLWSSTSINSPCWYSLPSSSTCTIFGYHWSLNQLYLPYLLDVYSVVSQLLHYYPVILYHCCIEKWPIVRPAKSGPRYQCSGWPNSSGLQQYCLQLLIADYAY